MCIYLVYVNASRSYVSLFLTFFFSTVLFFLIKDKSCKTEKIGIYYYNPVHSISLHWSVYLVAVPLITLLLSDSETRDSSGWNTAHIHRALHREHTSSSWATNKNIHWKNHWLGLYCLVASNVLAPAPMCNAVKVLLEAGRYSVWQVAHSRNSSAQQKGRINLGSLASILFHN